MGIRYFLKPTTWKILLWVIFYFVLFSLLFPIFNSQFWRGTFLVEPTTGLFPLSIWIFMKLAKLIVPYLIASLIVSIFKNKSSDSFRNPSN